MLAGCRPEPLPLQSTQPGTEPACPGERSPVKIFGLSKLTSPLPSQPTRATLGDGLSPDHVRGHLNPTPPRKPRPFLRGPNPSSNVSPLHPASALRVRGSWQQSPGGVAHRPPGNGQVHGDDLQEAFLEEVAPGLRPEGPGGVRAARRWEERGWQGRRRA